MKLRVRPACSGISRIIPSIRQIFPVKLIYCNYICVMPGLPTEQAVMTSLMWKELIHSISELLKTDKFPPCGSG